MTSRVLVRRVVPVVVVGSVFFFLGRNLYQNWAKLREYPWDINYLYLSLSFLMIFAALSSMVPVWLLILQRLGTRLSFKRGFRIWFLSALGKYLPGKVWQVVGMIYLCRREGISAQKSATSAILVQVLSIVPGVVLVVITINFLHPGVPNSFYFLLLLIPLGLVVAYPPALEGLVNVFARRFKRDEVRLRARYTHVLGFMLLYFFIWLLYGCSFFTFVRAMAFVHFKHVLAFGGVFTGAYLLGLFSVFVPGGLGVREGAMAFLLTPFFPLPVAAAISLASRIWLTAAELICVGISLRVTGGPVSRMVGDEIGHP